MRSMDQNSDQKRNSAHQKPGSRGTRRLAAHQRTLRMTRAQHRLRSPTAAERGWLRTRLTLRTLPLCSRSIRAQSTAPHRRSCTASTPAPHGRRAVRSKQKMSFEQGAILGREFRLRSARLVVSVTVSPRVSSRCTALNMSSRKICSDKV